jgi:hypothetical protein
VATTAEGARLTEAHRLAQGRLAGEALRDLLAVWPLLDPADDRTFPAYARVVQAVLATRRQESAAVSAQYLRAFREVEGVLAPLDVALAPTLADEQAMTSLLVTGPVAYRTGLRTGKTAEKAAQSALTQTAGAVLRHVQNGGRETVHATVLRDEKALGVQRVTDGSPCAFCAMLASRGAVYKSQMSADFEAHDKCGCGAEPVYRPNGALPGRAEEFSRLWAESTAGLSGDEARSAFRKAYNAAYR